MVSQSLNTLPQGNFALTFYWTANANGTVNATLAIPLPEIAQGMRIYQTETAPGSPAPTNGYSVALKNSFGTDLMAGAMASVSSTANQLWAASSATPPMVGLFTLVITGNVVANAQGTVVVYFGTTALINSTNGSPGPAGPAGPQGPAGTSPFAVSTDFIFTPQTPGISLGTGNNTITIAPVPPGVNGTDTKHYLYVSGGTGTAEAVLITGGTAIAGATSGTLIIFCNNTHSGAWTIQSATAGITEAETFLKSNTSASGGGVVLIPEGAFQMQAPIPWRANITFMGEGSATLIVPASSSAVVFDSDVPVKSSDEHTLVDDNVVFQSFVIEAASYTGINGVIGIRGLNQNLSTEVYSFSGIRLESVLFDNVNQAVFLCRSHAVRITNCKLYANSYLEFTDSTVNATYHSSDIQVDGLFYTWHPINGNSQVANMTTAVVTAINCESVYITNSIFNGPGGTNPNGVTFAGTGEDLRILGCNFENFFTAINLLTETISGTTYYPGFIDIGDNSFDSVWGPMFVIANGTSAADTNQVAHILIHDNYFTDLIQAQGSTPTFFNTSPYTKHVQFTGNTFRNVFGSATQTAVVIGNFADDIVFNSTNRFFNETGSVSGSTGIFVSTSAIGVYGLQNLLFTNFGTNINDGSATVASIAALPVPVGREFVTVTGTTGITSITYNGQAGAVFTLLFTGALTVTKGSNLKINANFVTTGTATDTLTLYWDGTNAVELSRSAN